MNNRMKNFYMSLANECSKLSRAIRLQVGCVIVKEDNIISFSWNGTPTGWDNNCEDKVYPNKLLGDFEQHYDEFDSMFPLTDEEGKKYYLKTKPEVLHAEMNALMKLAKSTESGDNSSIFITHAPCIECAKGIYQTGIKNVYYQDEYRTTDGLDFLIRCGINVERIESEDI